MAKTQARGTQIVDGSIQRDDLDPTTVGQAVIRKVIAGTSLSLTSTGGDAGTGDVTLNLGDSSGRIGLGAAVATDRMIAILSTAAHPGSATTLYGVLAQPTYPSTTTVAAMNYYSNIRTEAASFTLGSGFGYRAVGPTLGANSAITNVYGYYADNQGATGVTNAYGLNIAATSGAATLNVGARIDRGTTCALWLGGSTAGTDVAGGILFGSGRDVSLFRSGAGVLTIDSGAGGAGGLTLTTTGALTLGEGGNIVAGTTTGTKIGTGTTQKLGFWNTTPVVRAASAALTNNVTSGGSNDTIADYTSLATYSTDAAAIRNNIYQLARKVKEMSDALRSYGIFT